MVSHLVLHINISYFNLIKHANGEGFIMLNKNIYNSENNVDESSRVINNVLFCGGEE